MPSDPASTPAARVSGIEPCHDLHRDGDYVVHGSFRILAAEKRTLMLDRRTAALELLKWLQMVHDAPPKG